MWDFGVVNGLWKCEVCFFVVWCVVVKDVVVCVLYKVIWVVGICGECYGL